MPRPLDLTDYRPPDSRLIARRPGRHRGRRVWLCDCDCGTTGIPVTADKLRSGNTRSCGCLQKDIAAINCANARAGSPPRRCPKCGTYFKPKQHKQIYCDRRCKEGSELAPHPDAACEWCREPYVRDRSTQRFCSIECAKRGRYPVTIRPCIVCQTPFRVTRGSPTCCSPDCRRRHRTRTRRQQEELPLADQFALLSAKLAAGSP